VALSGKQLPPPVGHECRDSVQDSYRSAGAPLTIHHQESEDREREEVWDMSSAIHYSSASNNSEKLMHFSVLITLVQHVMNYRSFCIYDTFSN